MTSTAVVIELSPSRLELSLVRQGRVIDRRVEWFARSDWPSSLSESLADLLPSLQRMVDDLKAGGSHASIICLAAGSVTSVTSCPASAGLANAERAATLALGTVADFPIELSPNDTSCLLTEHAGKSAGGTSGWIPQSHVLATAQAESQTAALCEWAKQAGLVVERVVPGEALAYAQAVALATASPSDESTSGGEIQAVLWMGDHASVLAAGSPGRVYFVRPIAAGMESFIDAMCRPLRASEEGQLVTPTREQARALLTRLGLPSPTDMLPGLEPLTGAALLPHLQPVLQRMTIEVKQSLRFGIPEAARSKVVLRIAGPGQAIPRFADVVARQASVVAAFVPPESLASGDAGSAGTLLACPTCTINLLPNDIRCVRTNRTRRVAIAAGVAVAATLIGIDYASTSVALSHSRGELAALQARAQHNQRPAEQLAKVLADQNSLLAVEHRIDTTLGDAPNWAGVLSALAQTTPSSIRLTNINLSRDPQASRAVLRGYIRTADMASPQDAPSEINSFIQSLSGIPIVESVHLGTIQRTLAQGGKDAQSFDMSVQVLGLPHGTGNAIASGETE